MDKRDDRGQLNDMSEQAVDETLQSVENTGQPPTAQAEAQRPARPDAQEEETLIQVEVDGPQQAPSTAAEPSTVQLKAELERARQEAKETYEKMLRVAADADNIRKRALKERQEAIKYGLEGLLRDLLPTVDNLERTLTHVAQGTADPALAAIRQGVEMVLHQLLGTLESYDVKGFDSIGLPFDPNRHEAISRQESQEAEPGTVLSEVHRGYLLHDRLLRPALVVVACPPASQTVASETAVCPAEGEPSDQGQTEGEGVEETVPQPPATASEEEQTDSEEQQ